MAGSICVDHCDLCPFHTYILVLTSFKTANDVISTPPTFFPETFSLENYLTLKNYPYLPKTFFNSLFIATFSTIFTMLIAIPAAYGTTRYNTRYGQLFLVGALFTRLIPYISVAIPLFFILKKISMIDTYPGVIIGHMTVSLPFSIWLLSSFFEGIPVELEEAARIDGCSGLELLLGLLSQLLLVELVQQRFLVF